MSTFEALQDRIPDYARDLRLNLRTVLTIDGAPGLTTQQIWALALASAQAARNRELYTAIEQAADEQIDAAYQRAALTAAALMGMNNVYYRFLHLVEDAEYSSMPARLRMNAIANPGIPQADFELLSLAVSAINGCGLCITSHERQLRKHQVPREAVQSAVRIAAVVHGVAVALEAAPDRFVATERAA
jgi:alkyl hydroperoxide reductase subunit D